MHVCAGRVCTPNRKASEGTLSFIARNHSTLRLQTTSFLSASCDCLGFATRSSRQGYHGTRTLGPRRCGSYSAFLSLLNDPHDEIRKVAVAGVCKVPQRLRRTITALPQS